MDDRLEDADKKYFVTLVQTSATSSREVGLGTKNLEDWLAGKNSEISEITRVRNVGNLLLQNGNLTFERSITLAGEKFFDFFNYPMLYGDPKKALEKPNSIVLSRTASELLFGAQNPVGRQLKMIGEVEMSLQVTGVVGEVKNTHLRYDCLISWDSKTKEGNSFGDWYAYSMHLYIRSDVPNINGELATIISDRYTNEFPEDNLHLKLHALDKAYFTLKDVQFLSGFRTGDSETILILQIIVALILIIAVVNNININTSLVLKRIREIGVRKVMGANRSSLAFQLLLESLLLVFIAFVMAITIADLSMKRLTDLFGDISLSPLSGSSIFVTIALIMGFLSGIYPALLASRFEMTTSLRNQISGIKGKQRMRNGLMAVQFAITFGLLLITIVVYNQSRFIRDSELGFNKKEVMVLNVGGSIKITDNYRVFLNEIKKIPEVETASIATDALGSGYTNNSFYVAPEGITDVKNNGVMCTYFGIDTDFINTYQMRVIEGRDFDPNLTSDSSALLINKTLAKQLNFDDPIGKRLKLFGENSRAMTVIGVVGDFNFKSLHNDITPTAFYLTKRNYWSLAVRYQKQNLSALQPKIESLWVQFENEVPADYFYLDQKLSEFYEKDARFGTIISIFAGLSLLLSLIGLFGLTAFSIEQRLKEISIRKVLGANVGEVMRLFIQRVVFVFTISLPVAVPIGFWAVEKFLENFAYHIPNGPVLYISSTLLLIIIIITTVFITTLKASRSNPVQYLKED